MKVDKIMNNSYNSGSVEHENFVGAIKLHDSVFDLYKDQLSDDLIEYRTQKMLEEELYDLFKVSKYYEKYKKIKRIDKNDVLPVYYHFKENLLLSKKFSNMEIFIGIAEFFQINYDYLYQEIGVLDKERLLKEMSEKFGLDKRIKTKKLF
jgi:hypothetical protein